MTKRTPSENKDAKDAEAPQKNFFVEGSFVQPLQTARFRCPSF